MSSLVLLGSALLYPIYLGTSSKLVMPSIRRLCSDATRD
jgi:hypothetical protein